MGKRARDRARRTEFSADELPVYGCDRCRDRGRPADWHDGTMECGVCGKRFSYSGCSCDGCCGGTYAGFGGGRTTSFALPEPKIPTRDLVTSSSGACLIP